MGKLIYSMLVSLDGFAATADRKLDWFPMDDELHSFINEREKPVRTSLYGRKMYETMVYWQTADKDPDLPQVLHDYAKLWQNQQKIVVSKTLTDVTSKSRIVRDINEADIVQARAEGDVGVSGPTLAGQLIDRGLVDEIQLYQAPVLLGGGLPYFGTVTGRLKLSLVETHRFDSGVLFSSYKPA